MPIIATVDCTVLSASLDTRNAIHREICTPIGETF